MKAQEIKVSANYFQYVDILIITNLTFTFGKNIQMDCLLSILVFEMAKVYPEKELKFRK